MSFARPRDLDGLRSSTSSNPNMQRTVAVIHALPVEDSIDQSLRMAVEARISQAGFDILDENLMEGPMAGVPALASGLNLVYLLERTRAVSVWRDLVGSDEADEDSQTLSALYGPERFWSAKDATESLNAVNVLFPVLPEIEGTVSLPSSAALSAETPSSASAAAPHAHLSPGTAKRVFSFVNSLPETKPEYAAPTSTVQDSPPSHGYKFGHPSRDMSGSGGDGGGSELTRGQSAPSDVASDDGVMSVQGVMSDLRIDAQGGVGEEIEAEADSQGYVYEVYHDDDGFRARPIPATHDVPSIQPRLSRAALLRMGIQPPPVYRADPNAPKEKDLITPGVNQRPLSVLPKSLSQPTIAPRATKASMLRSGGPGLQTPPNKQPAAPREASDTSRRASMFVDTPGHRRSESIQVASTAPPKVAPRMTKAAVLRAAGAGAGGSPQSSPLSIPRTNSRSSLSVGSAGRQSSVSPLPGHRGGLSPLPRSASDGTFGSAGIPEGAEEEDFEPVVKDPFENTPGHRRAGVVKVAALQAKPKIEPRPTRAALLRAQKNPAKDGGPKPVRTWSANAGAKV